VSESTSSTTQSDATSDFPVFRRALIKYFPDQSEDLIENYHRVGESSIEFTGLLDEIKHAVAEPETGAAFLNRTLHSSISPAEAQETLIELHDMLAKSGQFSDEFAEEERKRELAEKATTDELFSYYLTRRIELPGPLAKFNAQLWVYPAASVFIASVLAVGLNYVPAGSIVMDIVRTAILCVIVLAVIVIFVSAVAMNGLRGERLHPEREREREREYLERKEGAKHNKSPSALRRFNPFK
jgi:hypothetical protein